MSAATTCAPAMTDNDGATQFEHVPVMLAEVLAGSVRARRRNVSRRHIRSRRPCARRARTLGPQGRLLLMDRDTTAIAAARREFGDDARVAIRHGNFADLGDWAETAGGLDGILLDLGVSSPQLDDAARGFSFRADAPLDMRMDTSAGMSAADFLAHADAQEIAEVLFRFGEETQSRRIARAIVETPARTAADPHAGTRRTDRAHDRSSRRQASGHAQLSGAAHPRERRTRCGRSRPARCGRSAQAGGRLAVISFHSLEDRAVKQFPARRVAGAAGAARPAAAARDDAATEDGRSGAVSGGRGNPAQSARAQRRAARRGAARMMRTT